MRRLTDSFEKFSATPLALILAAVLIFSAGCSEDSSPELSEPSARGRTQQSEKEIQESAGTPSAKAKVAPVENEATPLKTSPPVQPDNSTNQQQPAPAPDVKKGTPPKAQPETKPEQPHPAKTDPRVKRVAPIGVLQKSTQTMLGATALTMSPEGKAVAVAYDDGSIVFYEVESWSVLRRLTGNNFSVNTLAISADGKWLVSGGGDDDHAELNRWDLSDKDASAQALPAPEYEYAISDVAISPNGSHVLSNCLNRISQWSATEPDESEFVLQNRGYHGGPLAFSPDGKFSVLTDEGKVTVRQNDENKKKQFRAVSDQVGASLVIDADGRGFILGDSKRKPTRAWDFQGNLRMEFDPPKHGVFSLALTPDGKYLVGGGSSGLERNAPIRIWERSSGKVVAEWNAHDEGIRSLLLAKQGQLIVSTTWETNAGKKTATTKIWSLAEALKLPKPESTIELSQLTEVVSSPTLHSNESDVCLSNEGLTVYTTDEDRVEVYDLRTLDRYDSVSILTRLLPDGTPFYAVPYGGWKTKDEDHLTHIELSADGRTLLTADQRHRIRVWDTVTRTLKKTHFLHHREIDTLVLSPDGKSFLSTERGSTALVCRQTESGKELWATRVRENGDDVGWFYPRPVGYSHDGKSVAIAEKSLVRFIDTRSGLKRNQTTTPIAYPNLLAMSPHDGQFAISGSSEEDGELLCIVANGKQVWKQKSEKKFTAICFSVDGRYLFTTVQRKPSEIRDARDGKLVRAISKTSFDKFITSANSDRVAMIKDGNLSVSKISHLLDAKLLATVTKLRKLNAKVITVGDELLLDFEESPIADSTLAVLSEVSVPFRLRLQESGNLSDAALAHLQGQSNLVSLDITDSETITDQGIQYLEGLPNLREVILNGCEAITDRSMEVMGGLSQLETLGFQGTKVTGKGVPHLRGLGRLRELHFSLRKFEPKDFAPLAKLKELRVFSMGYMYEKVNAEALSFLPHLKKLETFSAWTCEIDDEAVVHLAGLSSLTSVRLSGNVITDSGCASFADLTNLEELELDGNPITDAGLKHFAKLSKLQSLDISRTKVTGVGFDALAGLKELREIQFGNLEGFAGQRLDALAKMPLMTSLDLSNTGVKDAGLKSLAGVKQLTTLYLPPGATDAGLTGLKDLVKLEFLFFHDESQITGSGLQHLKSLRELTSLDLSELPITDEGLSGVAQLHQLEEISLSNTKVTDKGLKHLLDLPMLEILSLDRTSVSDEGLKHMLRLPKLKRLELNHTSVTDQGLKVLEKITTLRTLGLEETNTTEAARKHLEKTNELLFIRE